MATLLYFAYKFHEIREDRERNWSSAVATVENARTQLIGEVSSRSGGAMLYEVQVLAAYSANGSPQERWITVDQAPKRLDLAEVEEGMWKGKQYFVRWNPSDSKQIVIDIPSL